MSSVAHYGFMIDRGFLVFGEVDGLVIQAIDDNIRLAVVDLRYWPHVNKRRGDIEDVVAHSHIQAS